MSEQTVAAGRQAWERLRDRERATWKDWIKVGQALIIGRTEAMKAAKTNKPLGSRYKTGKVGRFREEREKL